GQACCRLCLAIKTGNKLLIIGIFHSQRLDSNIAVQDDVSGEIHISHPAPTDSFDYLIPLVEQLAFQHETSPSSRALSCAIMTSEMLSSPPRSLARSIMFCAVFSIVWSDRKNSPSSGSVILSVRPSEHSNNLSPSFQLNVSISAEISASVPSAFNTTFFLGLCLASSFVICPVRTNSFTTEWSSVICLNPSSFNK